MAIIDLNGYCGHWPYWPIEVTTTEGLVRTLDRFKIDQVAVTSTMGVFLEREDGNRHTAKVMEEAPSRVIGFATVSPVDEKKACSQLARWYTAGMKGVRLFPQHHRYRLDDDPFLADILKMAEILELPVLIPIRLIANWSLPVMDVREIEPIVKRYPRVQFIIGGVNYGEFRDTMAILRRHENVGIETSCLQFVRGVKTLVDKIGAERVYLGTGLPLQYPAPGLAKVEHAEIGDDAKELILGGNAERLLCLK